MRYRHLLMLTVLATAGLSPLATAADAQSQFATCKVCHGAKGEGNRKTGAPNIAGMDAWYVERQLDNFAAGRRGTIAADVYGSQMRAAAGALPTGSERKAMAEYVAALPKALPPAAATDAKADLRNGANQYSALCSSCHQSNGAGNKALNAPRIAGIDSVYLARQVVNFRTALRGAHPDDKSGKQMAAMSKLLADAKVERDILAHVATLKP